MWRIVLAGLGYLWLGLPGALGGFLIGHLFSGRVEFTVYKKLNQVEFCKQIFAVMGHIAKADGHVSEQEIDFAQTIIYELDFVDNKLAQRIMQDQFRLGKEARFDLDQALARVRQLGRRSPYIYEVFLELLIKVALVDGEISAAEGRILHTVREQLGLSIHDFQRIEARSRDEFSAAHPASSSRGDIDAAYQTLGVSSDTSLKEVTHAYRKLISAHHPDKLMSRKVSAEQLKAANEKTQHIRKAYDTLKAYLGQRSAS